MADLDITETDIKDDFTEAARQLEEIASQAESMDAEAEDGFGSMIRRLPRLRCMVVGAAVRALAANRSIYDRGNKCWITEPDWNARLKSVVWIASYSDGLPAQTTLLKVDAVKDTSAGQILEAARNSPAMRAALRAMLEESEKLAIPG